MMATWQRCACLEGSMQRVTCWHFGAEYDIEFVNNSGNPKSTRPFRITFPHPTSEKTEKPKKGKKRKGVEGAGLAEDVAEVAQPRKRLLAESYAPIDPGPYPQDKPPENTVRFTPVQVI